MGFGKEKVVNGLKTLKRNFKDGLDKETQEWRRMNENHITKLNRRDVLKLMAIGAAGEALLAACAHPVIQAVGALTRTPEVKPSTTPTSETLGIQYGEVKVLDREGLRAKDATISTQVTALEAELKKRRPELFTAETQVDQLAILVPEKTMSGKTNFIYPFITVRNPESTKSFVAMVLVSPDGKGIVAQSLIPQDVSIDGMQKGALVLPTGSEMLSIFVFPRTVAEWSAMSDAEKLDSIIDFIPPQKGNVKIPLNGGKLASPAIWNMNIGYSSPNLTEIPPTPAPTATNAPTETATQAPQLPHLPLVPPTPKPQQLTDLCQLQPQSQQRYKMHYRPIGPVKA